MSASQIPNLLTLRGRGGGLSRGRGRGRGSARLDTPDESPEEAQRRKDEVVRRTDDDANGSRLSAVAAGLINDPFAGYFGDLSKAPRRMPIINRGTCIRTRAIDKLLQKFIDTCQRHSKAAQIISLGAGSDTRAFNFAKYSVEGILYHEIDLPENVQAKLAIINGHPDLRKILTGSESGPVEEGSLTGSEGSKYRYQIRALDLRELGAPADATKPHSGAKIANIAPDVPTLILSECCLCYLQSDTVQNLLSSFLGIDDGVLSPSCPTGLIFYEPINPSDSFGQTMIRNLQQRGIEMPTLADFPTLSTQRARFSQYGLTSGSRAIDIDRAATLWFTEPERDEISMKNPLDELEEWQMLAQHYCVSWGWRGSEEWWSQWSSMPE